jgi:CRP/FNR family cyclic AMP-dependent transcriptional regulator
MPTPTPSEHQLWQLPPDIVEALAAIGVVRSFARNRVIIQEGDHGDTMFVVLSGRVLVYLADEEGREVLLGEYGAGEHFGEMMLDHGPRSASVATVEPTRCSVLTRDELEAYLEANPKAASALARMLIGRVRILTRTVGNLALLDVYGRVARYLLERCEEEGDPAPEGHLLRKIPTQQHIASRIGTSRETVSRALSEFQRRGFIEQRGKALLVREGLDPKAVSRSR